jgi:hypothetical protein
MLIGVQPERDEVQVSSVRGIRHMPGSTGTAVGDDLVPHDRRAVWPGPRPSFTGNSATHTTMPPTSIQRRIALRRWGTDCQATGGRRQNWALSAPSSHPGTFVKQRRRQAPQGGICKGSRAARLRGGLVDTLGRLIAGPGSRVLGVERRAQRFTQKPGMVACAVQAETPVKCVFRSESTVAVSERCLSASVSTTNLWPTFRLGHRARTRLSGRPPETHFARRA